MKTFLLNNLAVLVSLWVTSRLIFFIVSLNLGMGVYDCLAGRPGWAAGQFGLAAVNLYLLYLRAVPSILAQASFNVKQP